ncbi:MAG: CRISPR-associated endonuclease Cas1 [candidate division KSB1 bacterium]|nr:CRISPR-associated endonuclease Cas1 [candidate division KSB1 bacterium]
MAVIYLTEQNAILRKRGERLVVEKERQVLLDVHQFKVSAVCLFGNVQVTTQAASALLARGIDLALFSLRGRLKGHLTPPWGKNALVRLRQYQRVCDPSFALSMSRALVAAKLTNCEAVLARLARSQREVDVTPQRDALHHAVQRLSTAPDKEAVRAIEGSATAAYFAALRAFVAPEWQFHHRQRRPPKDPVNALLSLGYVLLGNEVQAIIGGVGLDPYLGLYHELRYGRASLALDVLEPFRAPVIDRLTVRLLNLKQLTRYDFQLHPALGVRLAPRALKKYFLEYERWLGQASLPSQPHSFRALLRQEVEKLRRAIAKGEPYDAYTFA